MDPSTLKVPNTLNFAPLKWDDATFETWRYLQDEEADQVAESIILSPHHIQVYQALSHIEKNNDLVHINIFKEINENGETDEEHHKLVTLLNDYFLDTSLTTYLSEQKELVERSCDFFCNYGDEAIIVLAVRSLLKQYAAFKATNVLIFTKMLAKYPHRRILETMQFVMDIMDPNGFESDGYAIRSIQKLRLVHALIRVRIKHGLYDGEKFGHWQQEWGLPINQQDMIFALHTFSVEVINGLRASGEKISNEEAENFYRTWHFVGKALGIKDEINPMSFTEGNALQERIYKNQFTRENPNGPVLAKPLLDFLKQILPSNPKIEHIYAIIKLYNDRDEHNRYIFEEILKIPISRENERFLYLIRFLDKIKHKFIFLWYLFTPKAKKPAFYYALSIKNFKMLEAIISLEDTWTGKHFRISDAFGDQAAQIDEEKEKQNPPLLFRIAHKFVDGLDRNHPSLLVQIVHKLFFKEDQKEKVL